MGQFTINNGVLEKYSGNEQELTIPEEVTDIADHSKDVWYSGVFEWHAELTKVILPKGMRHIGKSAFRNCTALTSISIPENVLTIGEYAFDGCKSLTSVIINGASEIKKFAFANCANLEKIEIINKKCKIKNNAFALEYNECDDGYLSNKLVPQIEVLYPFLDDSGLKYFILRDEIWQQLSPELQAEIFLNRQSKAVKSRYPLLIKNSNAAQLIGEAISSSLSDKSSSKIFDSASVFVSEYYTIISKELTDKLYKKLKSSKNGSKAAELLESDEKFLSFMNGASECQTDLSPIEKKYMEILKEHDINFNVPETNLKQYYGINSDALPSVVDSEGNTVSPMVISWLLSVHEGRTSYDKQGELKEVYKEPGICPAAQEVVDLLDTESFHQALLKLADDNLAEKGKRSDLAYPICRYADENMMEILTKQASQWKSESSLLNFRKASLYSNTRAALLFADKYDKEWMQDLHRYAEIRKMDVDALRDQIISDTGLDFERSKTYNHGNQTVKIKLQKDLSFIIELPDGKTVKTLPKKNADPEKYASANDDFSSLKKNIKKIIKTRISSLFDDFLSGRTRNAESWKSSYLENTLLRDIASLLVWEQDGDTVKTFTLTESEIVDSSGNPYIISDKDIRLAYPAEMELKDLTAWQEYFTNHNLKQPFLQLWEPIRNLNGISMDRYKGNLIPYYRFMHQEKHGISVQSSYDGDYYEFYFNGCSVDIRRVDGYGHIEVNDLFEIVNFKPNTSYYTRYANHIVAYLDKITIWERIQKDDTSIIDLLPQFTAAQINEFISIATEANAVNVTAMLLEYKNVHYPDLDSLAEFTLDFL